MFLPNLVVFRLDTRNNRQKISKTQHTGELAEINPQSRVNFITSCGKSIKMGTVYIIWNNISRAACQKLHFFGSRLTQCRTAEETRHNTHTQLLPECTYTVFRWAEGFNPFASLETSQAAT